MLSKRLKKNDDANGSLIVEEEPKKKRRGSLFNRAKERNSFIDDSIQTTRRDRFAAQAENSDFNLMPAPSTPDPATMMDPAPRPGGTPTPKLELPLDPDPVIASPSTPSSPPTTASTDGTGSTPRLPSLDADFPQPKLPGDLGQPDPPAPVPTPTPDPAKADPDEDGYIPLHPKLPGLETIVPPSD